MDGDSETYWATDDLTNTGVLEIDFGKEVAFNRLVLQEYIALGQRVKAFKVEVWRKDQQAFQEIAKQTTIGYKRILRLPDSRADKLRITFLDAKGPLAISNLEVYNSTTEPK